MAWLGQSTSPICRTTDSFDIKRVQLAYEVRMSSNSALPRHIEMVNQVNLVVASSISINAIHASVSGSTYIYHIHETNTRAALGVLLHHLLKFPPTLLHCQL